MLPLNGFYNLIVFTISLYKSLLHFFDCSCSIFAPFFWLKTAFWFCSITLMLLTGFCRYSGRTNAGGEEGNFRWTRGGSSHRPHPLLPELNAGCDADSPAAVPQLCPVPLVPTDSAATRDKALPWPVSVLLSNWSISCDTLLPSDGYGSLLLLYSWEMKMKKCDCYFWNN